MPKKLVSVEDLKNIALGTTILGSGGGGDPQCDLLLACYFAELYGLAELVDVNDLADDLLVVPVGFMGAPSVGTEMLPNGSEFDRIFDKIEDQYQKKIGAIVASEIGGSNGLVPFSIGSRKKIPVLDGDTIGRAFPELQMSSCTLFNNRPSPCFLADSMGSIYVLNENSADMMEQKARVLCAQMGSSTAVSMNIMTALDAKKVLIQGSVSQAKALGMLTKEKNKNALIANFGLSMLYKGAVMDIESCNKEGFLEGKIVLKGREGIVEVMFQNEYLIAKSKDAVLAVTPDIIALFEEEQFVPLCVENVRYGMHVELASLPSPAIWKTAEGLALVGPAAFGYEVI